MSDPSVAGQTAREYAAEYPDLPTLTLARKMVREEPKLFRDTEHARGMLRYCRGESGDVRRQKAASGEGIVPTSKVVNAPHSLAVPVRPTVLDVRGKGAVFADLHVPYHDCDAVDMALARVVQEGHTDFLIINGDFMDFYQLSKFVRDPRQRDVQGEIEIGASMLGVLCGVFDRVILKEGNHDRRLEWYMRTRAPELVGVPGLEYAALLGCEERGIKHVRHCEVMHAAALTVLHGHEFGSSIFNPVNPARGMFLRAKACTLSGHAHQTSHHQEPNIRDAVTSCWSIGCLCDLHPEYAPLNKWDQSFALMEFDGSWFEIETRRIVKGRVT